MNPWVNLYFDRAASLHLGSMHALIARMGAWGDRGADQRVLFDGGRTGGFLQGLHGKQWDAEVCNLARLQVTPLRKMATARTRQGLQACNLMPRSEHVTSTRFLRSEWGYSAKPRQYWARAEL